MGTINLPTLSFCRINHDPTRPGDRAIGQHYQGEVLFGEDLLAPFCLYGTAIQNDLVPPSLPWRSKVLKNLSKICFHTPWSRHLWRQRWQVNRVPICPFSPEWHCHDRLECEISDGFSVSVKSEADISTRDILAGSWCDVLEWSRNFVQAGHCRAS